MDQVEHWRRRAYIAEGQVAWAERDREHLLKWMESHFEEERRTRDRLTFVYGVAVAHGATSKELAGP